MDKNKLCENIENLIAQAQNGEAEAFGEVFGLLSDDIYRFVYLHIGDQKDAQDITADTFMRAWVRLKYYKKNNFRAFLYRIARNLMIDNHRKRKNRPYQINPDELEDRNDNIETKILQKQTIADVYSALEKISKKYKDVIICRFIEELSIAETAKVLGRSQVSIRVLQFRAIKKLRKILKSIE